MQITRRKTFVAREDLLSRLSEIAKRRGMSLFATVNEIFELVIQIDDSGANLRSLVKDLESVNSARKAGYILQLENLCYSMADLAYKKSDVKATQSWFEAGSWAAKRYTQGKYEDPFGAFTKELENVSWNVSKLLVEKTNRGISVQIYGPRFSEPYMILYSAFLEGAFKALGYDIVTKDIGGARIHLEIRGE